MPKDVHVLCAQKMEGLEEVAESLDCKDFVIYDSSFVLLLRDKVYLGKEDALSFPECIHSLHLDGTYLYLIYDTAKTIVLNMNTMNVDYIGKGLRAGVTDVQTYGRSICLLTDDGSVYKMSFDDLNLLEVKLEYSLKLGDGSGLKVEGSFFVVDRFSLSSILCVSDIFGGVYIYDINLTHIYSHVSSVMSMHSTDSSVITLSKDGVLHVYNFQSRKHVLIKKIVDGLKVINEEYLLCKGYLYNYIKETRVGVPSSTKDAKKIGDDVYIITDRHLMKVSKSLTDNNKDVLG
jgi:hypothetical protein